MQKRNFKILGSALALALTVGVLAPTQAEAASWGKFKDLAKVGGGEVLDPADVPSGEITNRDYTVDSNQPLPGKIDLVDEDKIPKAEPEDVVPERDVEKNPKAPEKPEVEKPKVETPEKPTPEKPEVKTPEVKTPEDPEDVTPEVPEEPKVETPEEPEVPDSEGENSQKHGGLEDPGKPQEEKPAKPETPEEPEVKTPEKPQEAPTTPTKVEDKKVVGTVSTPSAPVAPKSTVRAQTGGGVGFGVAGLLSSLVGAFTALKKRY